jgi:hypothetical protein
MGSELRRILPRWLSASEAKKFPWDDERYWKKEGRKISKEPRDYARQIGMDIENQTVETEDGYYLRWVSFLVPSTQISVLLYDIEAESNGANPTAFLLLTSRMHRVIDPDAVTHDDGRGKSIPSSTNLNHLYRTPVQKEPKTSLIHVDPPSQSPTSFESSSEQS